MTTDGWFGSLIVSGDATCAQADSLLCFNSGWDCADLDRTEVASLRDYLSEWLENDASS